MREVIGRVSSIEGGFAAIEVTVAEGGCGRCHEPGGCGATNISRALGAKSLSLTVENTLGLSVGDSVVVGVEEGSISATATRVYVIPLCGLIGGGALGEFLVGGGSVAAILGATIGFVMAVAYSRHVWTPTLPSPRMVDKKILTCLGKR